MRKKKGGQKYHVYAFSPPKSSWELWNHFPSLPKHKRPITNRDLFQQNLSFPKVHRAFGHTLLRRKSQNPINDAFSFKGNCRFLPQKWLFLSKPNGIELNPRVAPLLPARRRKSPGNMANASPATSTPPPNFGVTALPGILLGDVFVFAAGDRVLAAAVIHPPARLSWELHGKEGGEKSIGVNRPRYPIPDAHPWVTGSGDNKATALDFGRALGEKKGSRGCS